jgi:cell division protein WhiA
MAAEASFTEAVRQELAGQPLGVADAVRAELSALFRFGGSLTLAGGQTPDHLRLELATTSGAVARRAYALLQHRFGLRPELAVRAPGGVHRRTSYGVRVGAGSRHVARDLGLLDARGRLVDGLPADLDPGARTAYLRGALLAAGSVSAPGRAPHLEIAVRSPELAERLAGLVGRVVDAKATATGQERPRVVVKSGAAIGDLLAATGATRAFLEWDERRMRRQLRNEATRLANADAANLRRSVEAAATQVQAVEEAVRRHGWDALDDELRAVALARLANPTASLAELGELADPPVGKSAVHRRLKRLEALATRDPADRPDDPIHGSDPGW